MEIRFLGTGAADWNAWPEEKDACDFSNRIRRFSSALVDETILIDPAPASYQTAKLLQIDCSRIKLILLTHSHSDHFHADTLNAFHQEAPDCIFMCEEGALKRCAGINSAVKIKTLRPMDSFQFDSYKITALPGNHMDCVDETALHYVIQNELKGLFYGTDGAWFTAPEWEWLMHKELDCAVLDCTCGDYLGDFRLGTHNSIPMIRLMTPSIRQNAMLKENGKIVLQHLARTLHKANAEVEADLAKEGYIVAKDGLTVTL